MKMWGYKVLVHKLGIQVQAKKEGKRKLQQRLPPLASIASHDHRYDPLVKCIERKQSVCQIQFHFHISVEVPASQAPSPKEPQSHPQPHKKMHK